MKIIEYSRWSGARRATPPSARAAPPSASAASPPSTTAGTPAPPPTASSHPTDPRCVIYLDTHQILSNSKHITKFAHCTHMYSFLLLPISADQERQCLHRHQRAPRAGPGQRQPLQPGGHRGPQRRPPLRLGPARLPRAHLRVVEGAQGYQVCMTQSLISTTMKPDSGVRY